MRVVEVIFHFASHLCWYYSVPVGHVRGLPLFADLSVPPSSSLYCRFVANSDYPPAGVHYASEFLSYDLDTSRFSVNQ